MTENYYGKCGMCRYCNLYDRDWMSGKFKCVERDFRVKATEDRCSRFENDNSRTPDDIEKAREGRL